VRVATLRANACAIFAVIAVGAGMAPVMGFGAQSPAPAKVVPAAWGCTTSDPSNIVMRATVVDNGNSVKSDGLGEYTQPGTNLVNAFALRTSNGPANRGERAATPDRAPLPTRGLSVDLSRPVEGGGGVPRGIWFDTNAVLTSFWYFDANEHVYALTDIPNGTTVDSERTQIWITNPADGRRHVLQFGPWSNM
jgi:hypothetical protein